MEFLSLENLFTQMVDLILADNTNVSLLYPVDKPPEGSTEDNTVFVRLLEKESDYSKQLDVSYIATESSIVKHASRTRVWELQLAAYGPNAYDNINRLKDGVFRQDIKQLLSESGVFLVPDMPHIRRITEETVAANLKRWDISLSFNELYILPDEDVGRIEQVTINTRYNK